MEGAGGRAIREELYNTIGEKNQTEILLDESRINAGMYKMTTFVIVIAGLRACYRFSC